MYFCSKSTRLLKFKVTHIFSDFLILNNRLIAKISGMLKQIILLFFLMLIFSNTSISQTNSNPFVVVLDAGHGDRAFVLHPIRHADPHGAATHRPWLHPL